MKKGNLFGWVILAATGMGLLSGVGGRSSSSQLAHYPVKRSHIVSEAGTPVVEIVEAVAEGVPQRLERYACRVRNNSPKEITALAVRWTITWSDGASESSDWVSQSRDSRLDPEGRPLAPGEISVFESLGPHIVEGKELKSLHVAVDYVEFADGTSLGPDFSGASQRIALQRAGAEAYRQRLWAILQEQGREALIQRLLQGEDQQESESAGNVAAGLTVRQLAFLREGKEAYRQRLLSIYRQRGVAEVEQKLLRDVTATGAKVHLQR
ncbi:hypothetical protein HRbin10_01273 [bacterium HR10]|nr:hypothetical protein HRbin10_01273 [bacterium HR10]